MMRRITTAVILCFVLVVYTHAQTKQALIKELFQVMQKDSILDRAMKSGFPTMVKMIPIKDPQKVDSIKLDVQERLEKYKEVVNKLQEEEMALYDKKFTQSELEDLLAFYKSPTGQKFVRCSSEIQRELQLITTQKYMQELLKIRLK
jgi:hypothetical protein